MTAPLRVGVWCAVSSRPQADDTKESLPAQRRAGEEFARAVGGEVVATYEVPGHTRDYWSWYEAEKEMPAYRKVREDLQAGKLDVIHCLDVDRLGRDPALIHQFYSLAERHNCEVYDASMPHVLGSQSMGHRYGMSVKSVSAGEDQRRRVARHRMGMRGRAKRGLHPGKWPLGYSPIRDDSGKTIGAEFDDMIGAVQLMTRLFLLGHSYVQIARSLDASAWQHPGGRQWYDVQVRRAMLNDIYAGFTSWGDARNPEPSETFPALWDPDTYAAILREREKRKGMYRHPKAGPLAGVVLCQRCGGGMGRQQMTHRAGSYYLRCTRHSHRGRWPGNYGCHPNLVPEGDVLDTLSEWLSEIAKPGAVDAALAQASGSADLEAELARAQQRLADLGPKRLRLAHALADGKLDVTMYYEVDGELRDEQDAIEARVGELHTVLAARPDPEERRRYIEHLLGQGADLRQVPADVLSSALHRAGVVIFCEDGEVAGCGFIV